ncbi:unnamed protein product, partial [Prunus brigantina]
SLSLSLSSPKPSPDTQAVTHSSKTSGSPSLALYSKPTLSFIKMAINRSGDNAKVLKIPRICSHYMNAIEEILEHISKNC